MTKREKIKRELAQIELITHAEKLGFRKDHWGNWKHTEKQARIKLNPNKVRFELKDSWGWHRYYSIGYNKLPNVITEAKRYLESMIL